jgi:uncharacterized protein YeaO (DUF488 family)
MWANRTLARQARPHLDPPAWPEACQNPANKETAMAIRIVRLGTARSASEGLRIGTVRRPPRGVPKTEFASQDWYDVWYPNLAPSVETMKLGQSVDSDKDWAAFSKKYRSEMNEPDASRNLDLLAALSHNANFAMGCYCENEARCHRSLLRDLLSERGALLA